MTRLRDTDHLTAEMFTKRTGRPPKDDDLDRVNCPKAGFLGHWQCGWCYKCNSPMFECTQPHEHQIHLEERLYEP